MLIGQIPKNTEPRHKGTRALNSNKFTSFNSTINDLIFPNINLLYKKIEQTTDKNKPKADKNKTYKLKPAKPHKIKNSPI